MGGFTLVREGRGGGSWDTKTSEANVDCIISMLGRDGMGGGSSCWPLIGGSGGAGGNICQGDSGGWGSSLLSWNESTRGGGIGGAVDILPDIYSSSLIGGGGGAGIFGGGKLNVAEALSVASVVFQPLEGGGGAGLTGCTRCLIESSANMIYKYTI